MGYYKVKFEGFAYVKADNKAEAEDKFFDEDHIYFECETTATDEVDECIVEV